MIGRCSRCEVEKQRSSEALRGALRRVAELEAVAQAAKACLNDCEFEDTPHTTEALRKALEDAGL